MNRTAALLVAFALGACSGGESIDPVTVEMTEGQRFEPASLEVEPGTAVTFVNDSSQAHTVTAYGDSLPEGAEYFASGGFGSEEEARDGLSTAIVGQEGSYEVTFEVPGTYEYFCIPHEDQGMTGTVVVGEV